MIMQSKTIKGKISNDMIKTIIFYNQFDNKIEMFEYNKIFSLEIFSQEELNELLLNLNLNKELTQYLKKMYTKNLLSKAINGKISENEMPMPQGEMQANEL